MIDMKKLLLILLCPFFLISQNYTQEFDSLVEVKNYDLAVKILEHYLYKTPEDVVLIELMGDAYGFQSQWSKAVVAYKSLLDLDPNSVTYHYKYAGVLGKLAKEERKLSGIGQISKVKTSFLTAAKLDPTHINVRWALVELYTQLPSFLGGSYKKALIYADQLKQLSKPNGYFAKAYVFENSSREDLAKINYKNGLYSLNELECFQSVLSHSTHLSMHVNSLHFLIAKACVLHNTQLTIGQQHIHYYMEAISSKDSKSLEEAYLIQSQLFKLQNNVSEALSAIEQALLLKPDFKAALKERQLILLLKP
jgi:tetratricopeptide (TPR) repeat protein